MIFALFTRRFRTWVFAAVLAPLLGRLLTRIGARLEARRGRTQVSRALLGTGTMLTNLRKDRRGTSGRGRTRGRTRR